MESTGFGLVERDGSPSERVLEAADDHRIIQPQWEIIRDYSQRQTWPYWFISITRC